MVVAVATDWMPLPLSCYWLQIVQSGREDGDHHKQLLVTVEVSSFDLDTHSTATRIVVVTAEDKIDLGCHRYSCYKRYE